MTRMENLILEKDFDKIIESATLGEIDKAIYYIDEFCIEDESERKLYLCMMCLVAITLLQDKEKPFNKAGIEKFLHKIDEIPDSFKVDYFPSQLVFKMAREWSILNLDYLVVYKRLSYTGEYTLNSNVVFTDIQLEVLRKTASLEFYNFIVSLRCAREGNLDNLMYSVKNLTNELYIEKSFEHIIYQLISDGSIQKGIDNFKLLEEYKIPGLLIYVINKLAEEDKHNEISLLLQSIDYTVIKKYDQIGIALNLFKKGLIKESDLFIKKVLQYSQLVSAEAKHKTSSVFIVNDIYKNIARANDNHPIIKRLLKNKGVEENTSSFSLPIEKSISVVEENKSLFHLLQILWLPQSTTNPSEENIYNRSFCMCLSFIACEYYKKNELSVAKILFGYYFEYVSQHILIFDEKSRAYMNIALDLYKNGIDEVGDEALATAIYYIHEEEYDSFSISTLNEFANELIRLNKKERAFTTNCDSLLYAKKCYNQEFISEDTLMSCYSDNAITFSELGYIDESFELVKNINSKDLIKSTLKKITLNLLQHFDSAFIIERASEILQDKKKMHLVIKYNTDALLKTDLLKSAFNSLKQFLFFGV